MFLQHFSENVVLAQPLSSNSVVSSPALEVEATVQLDGILAPTGVEQTHDTPPGVEIARSERTNAATPAITTRRFGHSFGAAAFASSTVP